MRNYKLCIACYDEMEGILCYSIRDTCYHCGGSAKLDQRAAVEAATRRLRAAYTWLPGGNAA